MSRVAPHFTKVTREGRRVSSSTPNSPFSALVNSYPHCFPSSIRSLRSECGRRALMTSSNKAEVFDRIVTYDIIRTHRTTSGHRPSQSQSPTPTLTRTFRTSTPLQAAHDTSTIDFFFFPDIPPPPPANPFQKLRVPLLPDNYAPDRSANSGHEVDAPDGALTRPEVVVVASHPEDVLPAALTEVVGNEAHERGIEELTKSFESGLEDVKEPGLIKELWDGLLDDIFGPKKPKISA